MSPFAIFEIQLPAFHINIISQCKNAALFLAALSQKRPAALGAICADARREVVRYPMPGNLPSTFLQHAKIQLGKASYEDYEADMMAGRSTCALCEGYPLCSLA